MYFLYNTTIKNSWPKQTKQFLSVNNPHKPTFSDPTNHREGFTAIFTAPLSLNLSRAFWKSLMSNTSVT